MSRRDLKEFRRLEGICRAKAEVASTEPERIGLLKVADDCQRAAAELECRGSNAQALNGFALWLLVLFALFLLVALYLLW